MILRKRPARNVRRRRADKRPTPDKKHDNRKRESIPRVNFEGKEGKKQKRKRCLDSSPFYNFLSLPTERAREGRFHVFSFVGDKKEVKGKKLDNNSFGDFVSLTRFS